MTRTSSFSFFRLAIGLVVVVIGVALVADRLGYDVERYFDYWPVALLALAAVKAFGNRPQDWIVALLLAVLGSWLLLYNLDYVQERPWEYFWPLVLIVLGTNLVIGALRRRSPASASDAYVSVWAVMGGGDRKIASDDFRGADITAIMGGGTVDLREAKIPSGRAEVRIFAFWGGVDLRVPPDWRIDFGLLPLLGGYGDSTEQQPGPDSPTLKISGAVIMGGMDLKN